MLKVYHRFLILVEGDLRTLELLTFGEKLLQQDKHVDYSVFAGDWQENLTAEVN